MSAVLPPSPADWTEEFTADSRLRHPRRLLHQMRTDLWAARELAWRLLVRNLSAAYRRTFLGYAWAFLPPLFTTATFVFLRGQGVVNFGETGLPYVVFVLVGTLLWQTFFEAVNAPLKMANQSRVMLAKIHFPREALILAGLGEVGFNFLVRLLILVPCFAWYGIVPGPGLLLAPLAVAALIAFGTVVGVLLLPPGVLYEDIEKGLPLLGGIWMFLSPVVYPPAFEGAARWLFFANPVSPLLEQTRLWLTGGGSPHLALCLLWSAVTLALGLAGWVLYRVAIPHLIARLPS
jgi:lipopolysaccharide transport system permease protein